MDNPDAFDKGRMDRVLRTPLNLDRKSRERSDFCDGMILPTDPDARKHIPITSGLLDYFPLAAAYVALVSWCGNNQHNPGQALHWARGKSADHADCIPRHLIDRGTLDTDNMRHTGKLAWRAMALLQEELEQVMERGEDPFFVAPPVATTAELEMRQAGLMAKSK